MLRQGTIQDYPVLTDMKHFPRMGLGCVDLRVNNSDIIDYAIKRGITVFDTADCYGNGESEKALGQRLLNYPRKDIYISSKCGVYFKVDGLHLSGGSDYINSSCQASLTRLQTDYIDLYYLHRVDPKTPIETSISALALLVKEGKIRHIGLSEVTADQLRRAYKIHPITAIQIEFSPWSRQDEQNGVIAACKELGVMMVAYSPLGRAFFTEREAEFFKQLPTSDYRKCLPRYNADNLESNIKARTELHKFAYSKHCTLAQLVLAWEINLGMVVIPATTNSQHLDENLSAILVKLTESDMKEIENILRQFEFIGQRYPNESTSGIYPEQTNSSFLTTKNILLGVGFLATVGGLFAYRRYNGSANLTSIEPVLKTNVFK